MEEHNLSLSPTESAAELSASALRELQQHAHTALAESREQAARLEADLTRQLDELAATLHEQTALETQSDSEAETFRAEIDRLTKELDKSRSAWSAERNGLESQRDELAQKVTELENRLEAQQGELTGKASEFDESHAAWSTERAHLESQRDELTQKVASLESQLQSSQAEWGDQLLEFENRLSDQQSSWDEQRNDWSSTRAGLERERSELQQKFDLALEDVQRLRTRVAELEQDLARRPESNQADSAELVALRAERDALSARVEQLEKRPATQIDPNVEQHMADLQRRFELAVEDVRELKTKNAKLESQLAAAAAPSLPPSDPGAMDWESQKRRLLAALDENAGANDDPVKKRERVTIESTIEMTDAVVAEKDRQIAELQSQLTAGNEGAACQIEHDLKVKELLDTDEVIAEHRKRVRELELEMEQKLRTAELELSVERAKMARQKVELEELRSDLESQRQALETAGGAPVQGQPRRRWLSKLGLTGEE
jgi:chromosome segregation ATPase